MAIHKLADWELEDEPYILIAIHSTLEPYRMAYLLNKHLLKSLSRCTKDQDIVEPAYTANYPVYKYFDQEQNAPLYLIPNKYWGTATHQPITSSLFDNNEAVKVKTVLIKEYGTVDFLLKIEKEEDVFPLKKMINSIGEIPQVISVYQIDTFKIKQQDYLIFE